MFELVAVWEDWSKDVYEYETKDAAEKGGLSMKMALGDQVRWYGVRRKM